MPLKNLLRPTRGKIIVDLCVTAVLLATVFSIPSFGLRAAFLGLGIQKQIFSILINILLSLVIHYPLSCGLAFIGSSVSKKWGMIDKKALVFAMLFVLLLNPFTYSLALSPTLHKQAPAEVDQPLANTPCGVTIAGFAENSPAKSAGLGLNDTILRVDGQEIGNTDSFLHALADKRPGDLVLLETDSKPFNVQTIANPNEPRAAFLGIKVIQKNCER